MLHWAMLYCVLLPVGVMEDKICIVTDDETCEQPLLAGIVLNILYDPGK
jgi:hypothetical protein